MANIASAEKISRRKKEILEASISVFAKKGFHSSCVADIAGELGIGHGTIYRYYKNKRDLFDAVLHQVLGKLAEVVRDEPPTTDSLEEYRDQLQRISLKMMNIFQDDPRLAKVAFYESMGVDPEIIVEVQAALNLFSVAIEQYMKNGVEKGFLRENMDQEIAARIITSMIIETIKVAAYSNNVESRMTRWRDEILQIMIGGLRG